jgi:hypothetical protein
VKIREDTEDECARQLDDARQDVYEAESKLQHVLEVCQVNLVPGINHFVLSHRQLAAWVTESALLLMRLAVLTCSSKQSLSAIERQHSCRCWLSFRWVKRGIGVTNRSNLNWQSHLNGFFVDLGSFIFIFDVLFHSLLPFI